MADKDGEVSKQVCLGVRADQNDVEVEKVKRARCSRIGVINWIWGATRG